MLNESHTNGAAWLISVNSSLVSLSNLGRKFTFKEKKPTLTLLYLIKIKMSQI